jgi:hypothetical protein
VYRAKWACIPRPLGRGDVRPRRESPEGPPEVAAINRPLSPAALFGALVGCGRGRWDGGRARDERAASYELVREELECDTRRSEPISSEDVPPLLHRTFGFCDLGRLEFLGGLSGELFRASAALLCARTESTDDDDDDVKARDGAIAIAAELARALACVDSSGSGEGVEGRAAEAGRTAALFSAAT